MYYISRITLLAAASVVIQGCGVGTAETNEGSVDTNQTSEKLAIPCPHALRCR